MQTNNRKVKMQTNKKTNPAGTAFDIANSINNVSRTANLYGKLFALQETQIYVLSEIKKVKEQLERKV
jgi:hypothetical protein